MTQTELDIQLITHVIDAVKLPADQKKVLQEAWVRTCARQVELQDKYDRRGRVMKAVGDALAAIKLDVKYLVFDLEATRRERDQYKRKSEQ